MEREYRGSVVGIGKTTRGEPAAFYAFSALSGPERLRRLEFYTTTSGLVSAVPLKSATGLRHYNAIVARDIIRTGSAFPSNAEIKGGVGRGHVFISECLDGEETLRYLGAILGWDDCVQITLNKEVGEGLITPTVAGFIDTLLHEPCYRLGAVTQPGNAVSYPVPIEKGKFRWISSHSGTEGDPKPLELDNFEKRVDVVEFSGESASRLAREAYEWLDPRYRVCTAAAIFKHYKIWNLGVCNLHDE